MALSATTRGLQDLASLRNRIARDYGRGRIDWDDMEYITVRLNEVETRLMDIAANDPLRMELEAEVDTGIARSNSVA
jgi:hypothetical protein